MTPALRPYLERLVLLEEPVPLGALLVVGLAVDGGLGLQGGDLVLDVDLRVQTSCYVRIRNR